MKDIIKKEIIGLDAEIIDSKNKSYIGIKGKIIDETKNTLVIQSKNGDKKIMKEQITLMLPKLKIKIQGKLLKGKPEERIKKKVK